MKIVESHFVLAVPSLKRSVKFYTDIMGFKPRSIEDPGWVFMIRDNCIIRLGECPEAIDPNELGDHSYFAYIRVDDSDAYFSEVKSAGGDILHKPRDEKWGMREFALRTIDGHRIMIGSPV